MPFSVEVLDETDYGGLPAGRATGLCAAVFASRGFDVESMGELSVALVGAGTIRDLNFRYRGVDAPTDVLSFEVDGPYGEMVGEIVISPEYMSPDMDLEELLVHGALHLSGMDHENGFEGSEMSRVQQAIMERMGGSER